MMLCPDRATAARSLVVLQVGMMLGCLVCRAFGKEDPRVLQPTLAIPGNASVERAGEVTVTLEAIPAYGTQLTFEISTPPEHGELSGLRSDSDHTAVVSYRHDGTRSPVKDRFLFRCKAPGRTKSVPYPVEITVIPPPARLVFEPGSLEFGDLALGERRRTNVTIANLGGARTKGRVLLPPGFSAPEGEAFNLGEGERTTMELEFSPGEERVYEGRGTFLPSSGQSVLELHGSGHDRFDLSKRDPLTWEVTNTSPLPVTISCSGGEGWVMPPETPLASGSATLLSFRQSVGEAAMPVSATVSVVLVSDGLTTRRIELPPPSPFVPVKLKAVTGENLGAIPAGTAFPVRFLVENRSKATKSLKWSSSSRSGGGTIVPKSLELPAGMNQELLFEWNPSVPGAAQLRIAVEEEGKAEQHLLWRAFIVTPATPATPATSATSATSATDELASITAESDNKGGKDQTMPSKCGEEASPPPPLEGLEWTIRRNWSGSSRLCVSFINKQASDANVRVDELRLLLTGEEVAAMKKSPAESTSSRRMILVKLPVLKSRTDQGKTELEIAGLSPGCHQIVLALLSPSGGAEAISQLQIVIPPKEPWWKPFRIPLGIAAVVVLLLLYRSSRRNS